MTNRNSTRANFRRDFGVNAFGWRHHTTNGGSWGPIRPWPP